MFEKNQVLHALPWQADESILPIGTLPQEQEQYRGYFSSYRIRGCFLKYSIFALGFELNH